MEKAPWSTCCAYLFVGDKAESRIVLPRFTQSALGW